MPADWRRVIEGRVVDIIQPDVCYIGGLTSALRVARLGAAAGLPCTPHSANLSMVTIFTMHLLRTIPNAGKYLELSIEGRSEEHTSELQSLMRISYAVFCLKKK